MKKMKKIVMLIIFICSFFTKSYIMIQQSPQDSDRDLCIAGCFAEYGCIIESVKFFLKKVSRDINKEVGKLFSDLKNCFYSENMVYF